MSRTLSDWSCSSGCSPPKDCRLKMCTNVGFPYTFSGSGKVSNPWVFGEYDPREEKLTLVIVKLHIGKEMSPSDYLQIFGTSTLF